MGINSISQASILLCVSCVVRKGYKLSILKKLKRRSRDLLELVHLDVCKPMSKSMVSAIHLCLVCG